MSGSRFVSRRGIPLELAVALVEPLPEVAAAVVEADADERDAELGGRLEMVAGEDAEAARVDRQALVEPELGREVRDEEVVALVALVHHVTLSRSASKPLLHVAEPDRVLRGQTRARGRRR